MIDQSQLSDLTKKLQTNSNTILREYVQLLFLEMLYSLNGSHNFIFKGGTAVHLMYGSPRFSEDLDFTITLDQEKAGAIITKHFDSMSKVGDFTFKSRRSFPGLRYLLTCHFPIVRNPIFMNIDFSFREHNLSLEKSFIKTIFPITSNSLIHYMGAEEIISEKIRAILTRQKGRDIYDLWYLLQRGAKINPSWVKDKFDYYQDKGLALQDVPSRLEAFPVKAFVEDLRPFLATSVRNNLEDKFEVMKATITQAVNTAL